MSKPALDTAAGGEELAERMMGSARRMVADGCSAPMAMIVATRDPRNLRGLPEPELAVLPPRAVAPVLEKGGETELAEFVRDQALVMGAVGVVLCARLMHVSLSRAEFEAWRDRIFEHPTATDTVFVMVHHRAFVEGQPRTWTARVRRVGGVVVLDPFEENPAAEVTLPFLDLLPPAGPPGPRGLA